MSLRLVSFYLVFSFWFALCNGQFNDSFQRSNSTPRIVSSVVVVVLILFGLCIISSCMLRRRRAARYNGAYPRRSGIFGGFMGHKAPRQSVTGPPFGFNNGAGSGAGYNGAGYDAGYNGYNLQTAASYAPQYPPPNNTVIEPPPPAYAKDGTGYYNTPGPLNQAGESSNYRA